MQPPRIALTLMLLLALACPGPTFAADGKAMLHDFVNDVTSFKADFQQVVLDEAGNALQTAEGKMVLQRPGKFRWDYTEPYAQVIVGTGDKVLVYDADLEQMTVKSQEQTLGDTPAQLLSARGSVLDERFHIRDLGRLDELTWVELVPRDDEAGFEQVRLAFADGSLRVMELFDALGNTTVLRFNNAERNPELNPQVFQFEPPAGTDVIGQ